MTATKSLVGSYRFSSGVLSAQNLARDLTVYPAALEVADNVDILPYGAVKQRPAFRRHANIDAPDALDPLGLDDGKRRIIPFEIDDSGGEFVIYLSGEQARTLWKAYKYDSDTGAFEAVSPTAGGVITGMHSDEIRDARYAQSHNTLLVFHSAGLPARFQWSPSQNRMIEDIAPLRGPMTPLYPGESSPDDDNSASLGVDAAQDIRIPFFVGANFQFRLRLNGVQSSLINITASGDLTNNDSRLQQDADSIAAALGPMLAQAIPDASGAADTKFTMRASVHGTRREITFGVEFMGPLGNRPIPRMQILNLSGGSILGTVSHRTVGEYPRVPAWSASRGYPTCGTFFGGRLFVASTSSDRQRIWGSRANDFFNFDASPDEQVAGTQSDPGVDVISPGDALTIDLNTGEYNEVRHLVGKEHLVVFTSGQTWYIERDSLTPTPGPRAAQAKGYGASRSIPRLVGDATYYITDAGALRDIAFDIAQQNYVSSSLSRRAFHLLPEPIQLGGFTGTRNDDVNQLFILNDDRTIAVMNFASENDHYAWSRYTLANENKIADFCILNRKFVGIAIINEGQTLVLCSLDGRTDHNGNRVFTKDFQAVNELNEVSDPDDSAGDTAFESYVRTPQLFRGLSYNGGELWASEIRGGYLLVPYDETPQGLQVRLNTHAANRWEDVARNGDEWIQIPDLQTGPNNNIKLEIRTNSTAGEMFVMGYRLEFLVQTQTQQ